MSVEVYVSSYDNEPRLLSFYGKTLDPQIGNVTLNSCHRSNPSLVPVTGMSDRIFYELFLLCSQLSRSYVLEHHDSIIPLSIL